jgi:hypothetical protein
MRALLITALLIRGSCGCHFAALHGPTGSASKANPSGHQQHCCGAGLDRLAVGQGKGALPWIIGPLNYVPMVRAGAAPELTDPEAQALSLLRSGPAGGFATARSIIAHEAPSDREGAGRQLRVVSLVLLHRGVRHTVE